jgi:hypothetical protein
MRSILGFSAASLKNGGGFTDAHELLCAGYTGQELRECGFSLHELMKHLAHRELWQAGFPAAQLLKHGVPVQELRVFGAASAYLKSCGCACDELLSAGYDVRDLLNGGFAVQELQAAGCRCDSALNLTIVSHFSVCSAERMCAAGVEAKTLWSCGLYSVADLKAAGYACEELLKLGCSEQQLQSAGPHQS